MSIIPHYIHIIKPKLKHIYLSLDDEGTLVIKSPKVSQVHIERLLLKKAAWITNARKKFDAQKGKSIDFKGTTELYFLGEIHTLVLVPYSKKHTKLTFDGETFTLYYSTWDETIFQKHIDTFYKKEIAQYLPMLVAQWAKTMHVSFHSIRFRKTKRQWGSCSAKNDLSFNTMLMKLPLPLIEYVVVHELSHIVHKHHQKAFWDCVKSYLPNYPTLVTQLKIFTT